MKKKVTLKQFAQSSKSLTLTDKKKIKGGIIITEIDAL